MTTEPDTELTRPWRTSSRSTSGNECVEVAQARENCLVRDSKQRNGIHLAVDRPAWAAFIRRVAKDCAVTAA